MKKTVAKLIVAVENKPSALKRSSRTISTYVNKVPCSKQLLDRPSQAAVFIQNEMREYPQPIKTKSSRRQQLLQQKLRIKLNKNHKMFHELMNKLEQRLSFLELEQMREIIKLMSERQVSQNKTGLKKLKNTVNYYLQSSQQKIIIEDHIIDSAKALINQIKQAQKKKVNQIV